LLFFLFSKVEVYNQNANDMLVAPDSWVILYCNERDIMLSLSLYSQTEVIRDLK
jgi:hypothetical protein